MKIIPVEQNSPEWISWRKDKLGASDAPIILGESPWTSPVQLWERKLGFTPEQAESYAMSYGKRLESVAREAFEKEMQCVFPPCVGQHEDYPWMIASFDGLMHAVLEIKCPGENDHKIASEGKVPTKYRYQLQHQLAVSGLDLAYYYSFDKVRYNLDGECQGYIIEVPRDQKMIDHMVEQELKFLHCMKTCTPPEFTERDYNPRHDAEWNILAHNWQRAKELADHHKRVEEALREELIKASHGMNSKGCGVKVQKVMRKGLIDYTKVNILKDLNLEEFRKLATESWRITLDD